MSFNISIENFNTILERLVELNCMSYGISLQRIFIFEVSYL